MSELLDMMNENLKTKIVSSLKLLQVKCVTENQDKGRGKMTAAKKF